MGIILVPDSCNLKEEQTKEYFLAANYNAKTDEEKEKIEYIFSDSNSDLLRSLKNNNIDIDGMSKCKRNFY